ncbi:hypothetical protein BC827DRAFT_350859 [Russula dissimulans]|jgi:hypothetical protein|nr:hypothetical protein BC827DRAFT_350859 [Russula dissimulans]
MAFLGSNKGKLFRFQDGAFQPGRSSCLYFKYCPESTELFQWMGSNTLLTLEDISQFFNCCAGTSTSRVCTSQTKMISMANRVVPKEHSKHREFQGGSDVGVLVRFVCHYTGSTNAASSLPSVCIEVWSYNSAYYNKAHPNQLQTRNISSASQDAGIRE